MKTFNLSTELHNFFFLSLTQGWLQNILNYSNMLIELNLLITSSNV